jgi:tight adherence protein B
VSGVVLAVLLGGLGAATCWARARAVRTADGVASAVEATERRWARETEPPPAAPGWWSRALADAGVEGDPRRWGRVAAVAAALAAAVGAGRGGVGAAVVLAATVVVGGGLALRAGAGRGARRADRQLPDLLEHAARGLRGGLDLVPALGAAADAVGGLHGAEVALVVARVDGGASLPSSLAPWGRDHPRPPVVLAVAALEVAALTGGARARALDGVAATLRGRAAVSDEARALASQSAASAAVLVALPLVVTVLGALADPAVAGDLLGTPVGLACLLAAVVLDATGAWWMHRIVRVVR